MTRLIAIKKINNRKYSKYARNEHRRYQEIRRKHAVQVTALLKLNASTATSALLGRPVRAGSCDGVCAYVYVSAREKKDAHSYVYVRVFKDNFLSTELTCSDLIPECAGLSLSYTRKVAL